MAVQGSRASSAGRVARGIAGGAETGERSPGMQFELRSGPTPAGVVLGLGGLGLVAYLVSYGVGNLKVYPPSGGYPSTFAFALLPMLFGLALFLLMAYAFLSNMGRTITVRKEGLRYVGGNVFFDANWGRFTYIGPTHGMKGLRSMVIGNRETMVRIDELFLPNFDRLNGFLESLMGRIESGSGEH